MMLRIKFLSNYLPIILTFVVSRSLFAQPDTISTKTYGGIRDEYGQSVQQTSDGGYIVTGNTWSYASSDCDVWLIKINALRDTLWTKTYGFKKNK